MRKTIQAVALTGLLVSGMALAGCARTSGDAVTGSATATDTTVADDKTEATDSTASEDEATKTTEGWFPVPSAEKAMSSASLSGDFVVPEKLVAHSIDFEAPHFSYVSGIARASYESPAAMVEVRKGIGPAGTVLPDDGTGMMGEEFAESWEVVTGDVTVTCHGEKKGETLFAQWYGTKDDPEQDGENPAYSLRALGLGGEDIPMTDEEVKDLVAAVK